MTQRSRGTGSRRAWPPLDKQLTDAKAPAGSQLEQLVRDNQDFALLDPAEVSDDLGFPLWLRVYWRKTHPELDLSGPTPGYPLVLERIHEWLIEHPNSLHEPPSGNPHQPPGRGGSRG
jgi:hypothetical protein